MSERHWFSAVHGCSECGETDDSPSHHDPCRDEIFASRRPGWGWCRLPAGHAELHELVWWNGEVTRRLADGTDETIERGRVVVLTDTAPSPDNHH